MKVLILALLALGSSVATASQEEYEIQMRFFAESKLISEPIITTIEGEESELVQVSSSLNRKIRLKLVATETKHPNIERAIQLKMVMEFEQGDKKKKKTHKHFVSEPDLIVQAGKEATISLRGKKGTPEQLGMKLVVKRR